MFVYPHNIKNAHKYKIQLYFIIFDQFSQYKIYNFMCATGWNYWIFLYWSLNHGTAFIKKMSLHLNFPFWFWMPL